MKEVIVEAPVEEVVEVAEVPVEEVVEVAEVPVEVVEAPVVVNRDCFNCDGVSQCSVCSPVFSDTFGA